MLHARWLVGRLCPRQACWRRLVRRRLVVGRLVGGGLILGSLDFGSLVLVSLVNGGLVLAGLVLEGLSSAGLHQRACRQQGKTVNLATFSAFLSRGRGEVVEGWLASGDGRTSILDRLRPAVPHAHMLHGS